MELDTNAVGIGTNRVCASTGEAVWMCASRASFRTM
jgi:hypothetical protein